MLKTEPHRPEALPSLRGGASTAHLAAPGSGAPVSRAPAIPATVRRVLDDEVEVEAGGELFLARLALTSPFQPEPDDVLLVLRGDPNYAIGVLSRRGRARLSVPGDLELRAGGTLRLTGVVALELRSADVRVRADRFEVAARHAYERVIRSYRWVREAAQLSAGRVRTLVAGVSTLRARRIVEHAEEDVKIDGDQIHLG